MENIESEVMGIKFLSDDLFKISLGAEPLLNAYQVPGQYIIVSLPDQKPIYLVISSSLRERVWDFYVRIANPATQALSALSKGEKVKISPPQGKGYPLGDLQQKEVVLFSAGTGLASFLPVIAYFLENPELYPKKTLNHSCRYPSELPDDFDPKKLGESGWTVNLTFTRGQESLPIRSRFPEALPPRETDWKNVSIMMCGPNDFQKSIKNYLLENGAQENQFFSNY